MPEKWSDKDERQYQHIKKSAKQRGKSTEKAEELAARTVNKTRRKQGRTPNRRSQGTGNPYTPLEKRAVVELRNRARELGIAGRSKMRKAELVDAIRRRG